MIKKMFPAIFFSCLLLASCSNTKSGLSMAEEVCECKMKTKGMSVMSPERDKIWKECLKIESGYFMKLQSNKEELDAFNSKRKACLNEIIGEYPN